MRNEAPFGYLDLPTALSLIRVRMLNTEIPPRILEAARENVRDALEGKLKLPINVGIAPTLQEPSPLSVLIEAIQSNSLSLLVWTDIGQKLTKLDPSAARR